MYTRCSHCKAIFRVTMKELTAAQGKLRCGECASVFNAMDSLSTKLPEQEDPVGDIAFETLDQKKEEQFINSTATMQGSDEEPESNNKQHRKIFVPLLSLALVGLLTGILVTQVWLTKDYWLKNTRSPDKVKMISRKVFTHPSQPDALIITGAIENTAEYSQPFPYLEARLLDANNQVVALRRFRPHEYIENYQQKQLLDSKQQVSIKLKIQDPPGHRAKQFKFSFL